MYIGIGLTFLHDIGNRKNKNWYMECKQPVQATFFYNSNHGISKE